MEELTQDVVQQDEEVTEAVLQEVDDQKLQCILEGAILASAQPLAVAKMLELFDESVAPSRERIQQALLMIQVAHEGRGFELKEVSSGWRFQVRDNLAPWVNRLWEEKPQKYSRALLETLALIAYRQPITRGDIEEIRGVAVSSNIMKTLMERDWVKVVGHRDVPGRPSLYATTRQFLDYFNLKSLEELPSLSEIRDLDEMNPALELNVDDEDLGTTDTDVVLYPEQSPELALTVSDTLIQEEFVDGESAFDETSSAVVSTYEVMDSDDDLVDDEDVPNNI